ncbi:unnamed protein product [Strongylus vulgaris]|uniref:Uncharacterized protein n=1 Tax=Strongylus vulgaris TaxID=40348 RepID=A0A3P7L9W7_STRVU|nr:unnamed protein product [Strongylus vulgaris]
MFQIAMMMLIDQIPTKIVDGHGFRSLMSFLLPEYPMPSAELFESTICPETSKQEEDSDSSCSVEIDTTLSHLIEAFLEYIGRHSFIKDELISLLTVCHSVFGYFEDRPAVMTELSLTIPSVDPKQPELLRDVLFVAEHAERINSYIRATPDMALLPISDAQSQTLAELVRFVRND